MAKITILGAGSWALGLAIALYDNGHEISMWSAVESEIEDLKDNGISEHYLPGVEIPQLHLLTTDLAEACKAPDLVLLAVASKYTRSTAARLKDIIRPGTIVVNVSKGIEEGTLLTMSSVIEEELPEARVCVLSGPSHAEEVARRMPTTVVVSAPDQPTAAYLQDIFANPQFRVYASPDMLGIEIGGSLKNVIALAAGIADGLGFGDNIKAALITRGIREISRLAVAMGARGETLYGLSGIGDLIVTCASMHSRNRRCGILLGQGKSLEEATKEVNMVVEGVVSAQAALALGRKYQVPMPIIEQVNNVLFEGADPLDSVKTLMTRDKANE